MTDGFSTKIFDPRYFTESVSHRPLLAPSRIAAALEARNEACCPLVRLLTGHEICGENSSAVLSNLSVLQLWRTRRVSRHFRRWATAALEALPRLVALIKDHGADQSTASMNLATMQWTFNWRQHTVPPPPLGPHGCLTAVHALMDRHNVMAVMDIPRSDSDSESDYDSDDIRRRRCVVVEWVAGSTEWVKRPMMGVSRLSPASVALPDGRLLVAGGYDTSSRSTPIQSTEVLSADRKSWQATAPMLEPRYNAMAGVLKDGCVIVAGGKSQHGRAMNSAERWD
eukprot:SAG11_NODE_7958_length_1077_cov_1.718814_1_plen_282_part_10